jgi:hypothetical protein
VSSAALQVTPCVTCWPTVAASFYGKHACSDGPFILLYHLLPCRWHLYDLLANRNAWWAPGKTLELRRRLRPYCEVRAAHFYASHCSLLCIASQQQHSSNSSSGLRRRLKPYCEVRRAHSTLTAVHITSCAAHSTVFAECGYGTRLGRPVVHGHQPATLGQMCNSC